MTELSTIWVFGDQLNTSIGALANASPRTHRILMVESQAKLTSRNWHIQRAHFLITSMRRFARELQTLGFEVDYRKSPTMRHGFQEHCAEYSPATVLATEPNSRIARKLLSELIVTQVPSDQFLCHPTLFSEFAVRRKNLKMEDFYRWQRKRLNYLIDGDEPVEGRWNFDEFNREPPPKPGTVHWELPPITPLDELDREVLDDLPQHLIGASPDGLWPTSRAEALQRLDHFITKVLPQFGPHEDAMTTNSWHLAHSLLSPLLNNGLLLPREVCDRVESAYRNGTVPIQSAEGFMRQVIGWREYVWNVYWQQSESYMSLNALNASMPLPEMFTNPSCTKMNCVGSIVQDIHDRAWVHHIPRLMVLGNFALIAGVNPQEFMLWMWDSFVDAAEWVMVPNVIGMSLHADGGIMATKPYAAGGAYIDRMSDYCKGCTYDRKNRTGSDACPFTTLYWDFLLRHADSFAKNHRIVTQVRAAQKLTDCHEVQERAVEVMTLARKGQL